MKKEQGMGYNFNIGDWVKIKDEDDYYNIKTMDLDSGFVEVQDISGHTWYTAINTIKSKCTNEEVYGRTEKTTADEFNEDPPVISIFTKDNGILDGNPNKSNYSHFSDDEEDKEKEI